MIWRRATLLLLLAGVPALAEVVSYEATSTFPEEGNGWERLTFCTPERSLDDGWIVQALEPSECAAPPSGDDDVYTRSIEAWTGAPAFFVETVVYADGESSEIIFGGPASITAWSFGPVFYGFTIARDTVKFVQDSFKVILFVAIAPDVPHKHRLEVYGDTEYRWYLDDELIYVGVPGGFYPDHTPSINWRAKSAFFPAVVEWDYVRYGDIPVDASGDFTSSNGVNLEDYYFFQECAENSGPGVDAGPGCRWADMDGDTDVDLIDFGLWQVAFTGNE